MYDNGDGVGVGDGDRSKGKCYCWHIWRILSWCYCCGHCEQCCSRGCECYRCKNISSKRVERYKVNG
ncbi:MAG: hypothetical protein QXY14_03290 [Candidatus Nitrosocaldus sp.]